MIFALRREGGDAFKSIARDWSLESPRFTEDGFEKSWAEFDEFHENPITIRSVYRLAELNGWKRRSKATEYDLLDRDAIMALKPIEWLVMGVFPTTGIAAIFGPSGSGKSFLALDLAMRIASGEEWFGRRTKKCAVTYVMLEGEAGLRNRIVAWEQVHGRHIPTLSPASLSRSTSLNLPMSKPLHPSYPSRVSLLSTLYTALPLATMKTRARTWAR